MWHNSNTIGCGEPGKFVLGAKLHVVAGLGQHFGYCSGVKRAGICSASATIFDDPNTYAIALR